MEKIETQFSVYKIDANLFTSVKGIKDKTKEQAAIDIIMYLLAEIKKELYKRDNAEYEEVNVWDVRGIVYKTLHVPEWKGMISGLFNKM